MHLEVEHPMTQEQKALGKFIHKNFLIALCMFFIFPISSDGDYDCVLKSWSNTAAL